MNSTVDRFSLTDLLHGKPRPPNISIQDWRRADLLLQSWIHTTVSNDLISSTKPAASSAHDLWTSLSSLSIKSLMLGSLSIYEYCLTIKTAADNLASAGHPLSDEQLVLQALHGLPKQYEAFANFVSCQDPLPSFSQIQSLIETEKYRLNAKITREFNDKLKLAEQGKDRELSKAVPFGTYSRQTLQ